MHDLSEALPAPPAGTSLAVGIQQAIGEAITQGSLPPGFRLREIPLSEHFACSTTPVREALRRLEHDGLVTLNRRRGAEVASINPDALDDLYETRLLLECHGARRAAELGLSPDDLGDARDILARAETIVDSDDFVMVNTLDIDFHVAISEMTGNDVIPELVRRVSRQIQAVRVRANTRVTGSAKIALRYHTLILDAVESGDPEKAAELMAEHINWSGEVVRASLSEQRQASGADAATR